MTNKLKSKKFCSTMLLLAMSAQTLSFSVSGQSRRSAEKSVAVVEVKADEATDFSPNGKIAPDLKEKTDDYFYGRQAEDTQKIIIQLKSDTALNEMSENALSEGDRRYLSAQEVRNNKAKIGMLVSGLAAVDGTLKKSFNNLGLVSAELPLSKIRELAQSETVEYISPDREVESFGHVETVVGAGSADGRGGILGIGSLTGAGVGIAVLDSGVDTTHSLTRSSLTRPSVVYSKTYTSVPIGKDYNGHGTHVTSLLAGSDNFKNGAYTGIAYESKIINLGVLDAYGKGSSSSVIAAIDWVIANKSAYNIRVINMSLGTPPKDSYTTDPLCLAARRAYNAGIVVVASAGNFGKDIYGNKLYGGINSPGIEPSVITVGAVNTYGTNNRYDDTVATYSSSGPTRGYKTVNGVKKYDNLIKPDLVAPGNKLIAAVSPSSTSQSNSIINKLPLLNAGGTGNERMMYLSGTSMAAPLVSGAVAMMLEERPDLTPALVKAILMYSAQPIKNTNALQQGAGMLNVEGATDIVKELRSNLTSLAQGADMLGTFSDLEYSNSIDDSGRVYWGKGVITNYGILYGDDLMNKWQGMYASGVLISDGTAMSGTTLIRSAKVTTGVNIFQGAIKINSNGVLVSDGTLFMSSSTMSNGSTLGQGVLVSDGVLISDGVLVSDGYPMSTNALTGDNTMCMFPAP